MELGKKIASLRKIKKVTQMQLAEYSSAKSMEGTYLYSEVPRCIGESGSRIR